MSLVIFDGAIATLLNQKKAYLNGLWYGLFTNNHTPVHGDNASNYTEPTYTGYARQQPVFPSATFNGTLGEAQMVAPILTFQPTNNTGLPQNIYGYVVFDAATGGNAIYAELYAGGPFSLADDTKVFLVTPQMADTYQ